MKENTITNTRENYIDVLKGIGILLVVFAHICTNSTLTTWIYSFHMPLFFIISGFLWAHKTNEDMDFLSFLKKKSLTLLYPFILFRVLLVAYWFMVESRFRELDLGPIWFLITLYVAEVIAFLLIHKKGNVKYVFTVVLGTTVLLWVLKVIGLENFNMGSWLLRVADSFLWYVMGIFIGLIKETMTVETETISGEMENKGKKPIVVLAVLFIYSIVFGIINGNVSMWSSEFGFYPFFIVSGVIGTLAMAGLCKYLINKNVFLEYLGRYTIIILATHEPIKRVIEKIIEVVTGKLGSAISQNIISTSVMWSFLVTIIVIDIDLIVIYIFRKIKSLLKGKYKTLLIFVKE